MLESSTRQARQVLVAVILMDREQGRRRVDDERAPRSRPIKQPLIPFEPTDGERGHGIEQPARKGEVVDGSRDGDLAAARHVAP